MDPATYFSNGMPMVSPGMMPAGYAGPPVQQFMAAPYPQPQPIRVARFPAEELHGPPRPQFAPPAGPMAPRPAMHNRSGSAGSAAAFALRPTAMGPAYSYQQALQQQQQQQQQAMHAQMTGGAGMPQPMPGQAPGRMMMGPPPFMGPGQPMMMMPMPGPPPGYYAQQQQQQQQQQQFAGQPAPMGAGGAAPAAAGTPSGHRSRAHSGSSTPAHPMQRMLNPQAGPFQQAPLTVAPPPGVLLPDSLSPGSPGPLGPAVQQQQQQLGALSRTHSAGSQAAQMLASLRRSNSQGSLGSMMAPLTKLPAPGFGGAYLQRSTSNGQSLPAALVSGGSLRSSLDVSSGSARRSIGNGSAIARGGTPGSPSKAGLSAPASRAPSAGRRTPGSATPGGSFVALPGAATEVDAFDNIKVAVRVRPPNAAELARGDMQALFINPSDCQQLQLALPGPRGGPLVTRPFTFHACLGPESGQQDVMRLCGIPQLLDAAMDGFNATVMAYGQTGSGKTYTMSGREDALLEDGYSGDSDDGIIARSLAYLYDKVQSRTTADGCSYRLRASFCEIYNEQIFDLLTGDRKQQLQVRWDSTRGFHAPELQCRDCGDQEEALAMIARGVRNRRVGCHELNMESSRSHAIFTVYVDCTPTRAEDHEYGVTRYGKISFVDLAGSERLRDSKSSGETMRETTNINRSLFMLGKVIAALADGAQGACVPYRESKLTKLLQDSLGGSALCLLIACCSPSAVAAEETLSTLSYAARAKNIRNRPAVQVDPEQAALFALRREVKLLRTENAYLREQLMQASLPRGVPSTPGGQQNAGCTGPPGTPGAFPAQALSAADGSEAAAGALSGAGAASERAAGLQPGWQGASRPASSGTAAGAAQPSTEELMRRLLETQRLLVAVSRENDRLAGVNQRLADGRQLVADDYKGALEEVDWLRSKLERLEQALLGGVAKEAGGLLLAGLTGDAADGSIHAGSMDSTDNTTVLEAARAAVRDSVKAWPEAGGGGAGAAGSGALEPLASRLAAAVRSASMAAEAALMVGEAGLAPEGQPPQTEAQVLVLPAGMQEPPRYSLMAVPAAEDQAAAPLIEQYLVSSPSEVLQQAGGLMEVRSTAGGQPAGAGLPVVAGLPSHEQLPLEDQLPVVPSSASLRHVPADGATGMPEAAIAPTAASTAVEGALQELAAASQLLAIGDELPLGGMMPAAAGPVAAQPAQAAGVTAAVTVSRPGTGHGAKGEAAAAAAGLSAEVTVAGS